MSELKRNSSFFRDGRREESGFDTDGERQFWVCTICEERNYGKVCNCGIRKEGRTHQQRMMNQGKLWQDILRRKEKRKGKK